MFLQQLVLPSPRQMRRGSKELEGNQEQVQEAERRQPSGEEGEVAVVHTRTWSERAQSSNWLG